MFLPDKKVYSWGWTIWPGRIKQTPLDRWKGYINTVVRDLTPQKQFSKDFGDHFGDTYDANFEIVDGTRGQSNQQQS